MHLTRPNPVLAVALVALTLALTGCASTTPAATPHATDPAATSAATSAATTAPPTLAASLAPTAQPSAPASAGASQVPIATPVPGSSLDPALSDAGIVGRVIIPDDTRTVGDDDTGTHDILGVAVDGSSCSFSIEGDEFTAVAWYDDAPNGMLHQMAVTVPADEMPANDGEQRAGIDDGRVYADFVSEGGFGTAYSGDATTENSGAVSIDIAQSGDTLTFSFTGTTWDAVAFSGQMICTGIGS